ncbi:MAG: VWA domain-containing protein, partial [Gemmatimonadota bacterium]|nr:VWA domain-containing protein [Gemmatimonadota bacterium]
ALILRCLAIILLALMLAAPVTRSRWLARLARPLGGVAVVADTSASMSARVDRTTPVEVAREAMRTILDAVPAGTPCVVASASSRTHVLPPADPGQLARQIVPTGSRGRLDAAVAHLLRSPFGPSPATVFVLSDLQRTSFCSMARMPRSSPARVIALDCGVGAETNRAVTGLRPDRRVIVRGRPLVINVRVEAWGADARRVPLSVVNAGEVEASQGVTPTPDAPAHADLELLPRAAGLFVREVTLPADHMPGDNARRFATVVRERLRVVVVGDEERTRFVRAALDPFDEGDPRSVVQVLRASASDLEELLRPRPDAVVVAARLPPEGLSALREALSDGVGILVFAGPAMASGASQLAGLGVDGVRAGDMREHGDGRALSELATRRPPLAGFAEPGSGDLQAARFTTTRALAVEDRAASVLARFDDGSPALVEVAEGKGRALVFATSANDAWSDLSRLPAFVPLMHRLVEHLAAPAAEEVLAGAPGEVAVGPAGGREIEVRRVGGEAQPVSVGDGVWRVTPERAGAYEVCTGGRTTAAFAVNVDRAEADPTALTTFELRERLRPLQTEIVDAGDLPGLLRRGMGGAWGLSSLTALLALLVIALEAVQSLEPETGGHADE